VYCVVVRLFVFILRCCFLIGFLLFMFLFWLFMLCLVFCVGEGWGVVCDMVVLLLWCLLWIFCVVGV
jgi:hypothetical protein